MTTPEGPMAMYPHSDEGAENQTFPNATPAEQALWDAVFAAVAPHCDAAIKAHRMANAAVECRRKSFPLNREALLRPRPIGGA